MKPEAAPGESVSKRVCISQCSKETVLICEICGSKTTHFHHFNKMLIWKKCEFLWIFAKKARIYTNLYPIHVNFYSFLRVFWRIFLTYIAQATQAYIATPIFDSKTRIRPQNQKKT